MKFQITNTSFVVWFWVNSMLVFEVALYYLDLSHGCKKKTENVGFLKEMLSKFCKNSYSCFGYRLSYNHPNEVIPIGKEP